MQLRSGQNTLLIAAVYRERLYVEERLACATFGLGRFESRSCGAVRALFEKC